MVIVVVVVAVLVNAFVNIIVRQRSWCIEICDFNYGSGYFVM